MRRGRDRLREPKHNREEERTSHRFLLIPFPMAFAPKRKWWSSIAAQVAPNGGGGLDEIEPVWKVARKRYAYGRFGWRSQVVEIVTLARESRDVVLLRARPTQPPP
jgi:hypothetical protein